MGKIELLTIAVAAAVMGCSSASTAPALGTERLDGGLSSSSGGGGVGASSGAGSRTFAVGGVLNDATGGGPVTGASVCLIATPSSCTMTDSTGTFLMGGLAVSRDGFTASLAGYVTGIWPITPTGDATSWSVLLRSTTRLTNLAQSVGTTFDSSMGAVIFAALDASGNSLAGASVSIASGGTVAYFKADGSALDSTLAATTAWGEGFAFRIPAGTVGVTFTAPGKVCVRSGVEGWPGGSGQTMTVPVVAGQLTRAAAVCQ